MNSVRGRSQWRVSGRIRLGIALGLAVLLGVVTGLTVRPVEGLAAARNVRDAQLITPTSGWALTIDRLVRTDDGGATWRAITPAAVSAQAIADVHFLDALHGWIVATGPPTVDFQAVQLLAYRTIDGGVTWLASPIGATKYGAPGNVQIAFTDVSQGFVNLSLEGSPVIGPSQMFVTRNGGLTWTETASPARGSVSGAGGRTWLAGGSAISSRLFTSTDGGRNWTELALPPAPSHSRAEVVYGPPVALDELRAVLVVSFARDVDPGIGVYVTDDAGATWTLVADIPTPTLVSLNVPVAIDVIDASAWVAILPRGDAVYRLRLGAQAQKILPQGLGVGVFEIWFPEEATGWALCFDDASGRARIFKTEDGGRTWRELAP